jgi:serine/threonine-protein phosphatase PGAM5
MQRVQRILNRFFVPSRAPRQEVIVCHGNLIRWLMLFAVSGRTVGWRRFLTHHAGITTFLIAKEGICVVGFNQCSHLPAHLRTYL